MASAGIDSRRRAEILITEGRVMVNGKPAHLGMRVNPLEDRIDVDGVRIQTDPSKRYVMLNKPAGVISTSRDPQGRPTVVGLLETNERLFPVGRLDAATEGLILLTNDGDLAFRLTHPSFEIDKVYVAEVLGAVEDSLVRKLTSGVKIEGAKRARATKVRVLSVSRGRIPKSVVEVTIHEGRKHVIRKMLEFSGHPVVRLYRRAIGPLRLTGVKPGEHRDLTAKEVAALFEAAGLSGND